jgi:CRP-like cAMP-binding protein
MTATPEFSKIQLEQFTKHLAGLGPVPETDIDKLLPFLHYKKCSKGKFILKEGQVCRNFYFILNGLVRGYSVHNTKEVNVEFFFENYIASDFLSLRNETPSRQFLIAMEPCEMLYAAKADYLQVFQESVPLTTVGLRLFQNMFFEEEAYSTMFKALSPEERYHFVLTNRPYLIQRIPLKHLANYLGMSRETLSRIRGRI